MRGDGAGPLPGCRTHPLDGSGQQTDMAVLLTDQTVDYRPALGVLGEPLQSLVEDDRFPGAPHGIASDLFHGLMSGGPVVRLRGGEAG